MWYEAFLGRYYFVTIDKDRRVDRRRIRGRLRDCGYEKLWESWHGVVTEERSSTDFEYSTWSLQKEQREKMWHRLIFTIFGCLLATVGLLLLYNFSFSQDLLFSVEHLAIWKGVFGAILTLLLAGFFLWVAIQCGYRQYQQISLADSGLRITYLNGEVQRCPLDSIKYAEFRISYEPYIVFEDAANLRHLERVSDWPILREYLLSKVQPKPKPFTLLGRLIIKVANVSRWLQGRSNEDNTGEQ